MKKENKLYCSKHNRILIGKDRCIECQPKENNMKDLREKLKDWYVDNVDFVGNEYGYNLKFESLVSLFKQQMKDMIGKQEEIKFKSPESYCGSKDCGNHTLCAGAIGSKYGRNNLRKELLKNIEGL